MSSSSQFDTLRVLQWNAGGLSQSKRMEILQTLGERDVDVFAIMEANLTDKNLKYYSFRGFSLYVLKKFRQVASGILIGVKRELTADFRIIKEMGVDGDKSEVVHLDVWKCGVHFKILAIYSPPGNDPDFSYVNHSKHSMFIGDFNAHSPVWGYSDTNKAGRRVQDFLSSSNFELIFNKRDPHTYLHYNGRSTTPDLLMVTADLHSFTKRSIMKDPGSGHRQVLAEIMIPKAEQRPFTPSKTSWNFKKANWPLYTRLVEQELTQDKLDFALNPSKIYNTIKDILISCAKKSIPRGRQKKYRSFWTDELTSLKDRRDRLRRKAELTSRPSDVQAWRKQSAYFRKKLTESKRSSYNDFISNINYQSDSKKVFKFVGNLMNDPVAPPKQSFMVDDKKLSSDSSVASAFVQYFCGAGCKGNYAKLVSR
ncbi:hypothetical protein JTE90_015197 [Oedothorax gibbosus]|uniref:Endonuclease/exonuclease/phosphatase domain-containing protein n=1 Tax=Oedothorax gibbosus TaxID=931172 RepID=A0AAV6V7W4_9ARAC|nr:hypothetical protein JTE90_015197 [Oedothorax gibbosus]